MNSRLSGLLSRVSGMAPVVQQTISQSLKTSPSAPVQSGPLVNIETMEVTDRFDEQRFAADLSWRVSTA